MSAIGFPQARISLIRVQPDSLGLFALLAFFYAKLAKSPLHGINSANSRADANARPIGIDLLHIEASGLYRLVCRYQGELG